MGSASALGAHIILGSVTETQVPICAAMLLGFGLLEALSPAIVSATTDIDPQTAVKSNLLFLGSRVVHAAQTVMRHPKYVIVNGAANVNFNFDVSLVRLKEALVLGTQASTIALTSPGARAAVGANITVAGFGIYDWGEDDNGKPRLKQGQIMNSVVCGNQMLANITPEEFCVSNPPDNGNSGCPAFIGNVLYGIMSWGSTVFVDVAEPEINTFISMNIKV
ncbi:hypothetical protein FOCC_FOCC001942 [Frankliniella occidentalis]|nr:hypothetical protein FOCC_FOCC001942 [Frankliniella occidentalis]